MLVKRTFVGMLLLLASAAHAQTSRGIITGTVLDASGARLSALCPHATRSDADRGGRHQPGRNAGRYMEDEHAIRAAIAARIACSSSIYRPAFRPG